MDATEFAIHIVERALGITPVRAARQHLSKSGNAVYRVWLDEERSVCLRMSNRRNTFAYTARNLAVLRALGCPVQYVLADCKGAEASSYIILNWLPGRDLIDELPTMGRSQISRVAERVVHVQRRVSELPLGRKFGWAPIGRSGSLDSWDQVFGPKPEATTPENGDPIEMLRGRLNTLRHSLQPYFATIRPACFLDDLTAKNLLIDQGDISGIIDVDYVCYGDPLMAVGSTLAGIVADMSEPVEFYALELIRYWNPTAIQQQAICFYAALWMFGFLRLTDVSQDPARARRLTRGVNDVLASAEKGATLAELDSSREAA